MNRKSIIGLLLFIGASAITIANWPEPAEIAPAMLRRAAAAEQPRIIVIKARRFQFSPQEITLRQDEPVILRLSSEDRAHGFLLKPLKIDADISPGASRDILVVPRSPGHYTAICDHYCGTGHGNMKMTVVVTR